MKTQRVLPPGFTSRPATFDDLDEVTEMLNLSSIQMLGNPEFTPNEIVSDLATPNFDIEKDTRVVLDPKGKIVGYQDVFATSPIPVRPMIWGRVHPEYMGSGIGSYLFAWGLDRARHVLDKVPPEIRVTARAFEVGHWQPSIDLFLDHGFTIERYYFNMRIDMDAPPPAPDWPEGIQVRVCDPQKDLRAFFHAFDDSFKDHFGHIDQPFEEAYQEFCHHTLNSDTYDPALWFQAMDGNQVAGICMGQRYDPEDENAGDVNLLGVRRPWRQRGLGLAMLRHIFNEYWQRGQKAATLGVDADSLTGAVRLYEKAGMYVFRENASYELELRPGIDLRQQTVGAE